MRCPECGGQMELSHAPITEEFRGEAITVRGVAHHECPECGEVAFDADSLDEWSTKIDDAYREMNGLLKPSEIREIRLSHDLSQKEFEAILGVSSPTVSRWETGKVCHTKSMDRLLRLLRKYPEEVRHLAVMEEIQPVGSGTRIISFDTAQAAASFRDFVARGTFGSKGVAAGEFGYTMDAKEC